MYMKLPKKLKLKAITRTKWEETKNCNKNKKKIEMQKNRGYKMNSVGAVNSAVGTKFRNAPFFFVFFALLSFWSLICNAEFDPNSSCLDRLNNFGIISSQKL